MDNLQTVQNLRDENRELIGEIKRLRLRYNESNTLHHEREKELLRAITLSNRKLKAKTLMVERLKAVNLELRGV